MKLFSWQSLLCFSNTGVDVSQTLWGLNPSKYLSMPFFLLLIPFLSEKWCHEIQLGVMEFVKHVIFPCGGPGEAPANSSRKLILQTLNPSELFLILQTN